MKRKLVFILTAIIINHFSFGQITDKEKDLRVKTSDTLDGWKKGGIVAFNLSQVSLTNWSAGGMNSLAFNGLLHAFACLKHDKSRWDNMLDVGYGLIHQGDKNAPYQKSDDKFEINSKYGQEATKSWYYAALVNFKTQMAPGYNYPNDSVKISDLLAPANLIGALGMDYKPNNVFDCFIAPVTGKLIIVDNTAMANAGDFGVDPAVLDDSGKVITPGKKTKFEFGGYLRVSLKKDIMKNINLATEADFFSNYLLNPQNIVINWQVLISMKINKFISATLSTQLLYDDKVKIVIDSKGDTGPRTQFKELFGVGLSYKF
ncbi:MAG: DUF3078 domain-containing protein [Bacteroidales bacterium]|jgi:hypothetical protein